MFVGFSFTHYGNYLGIAALATGLVTMVDVVMLQVMPQRHTLWGSVLIVTSLAYWASLFVWYGRYWGLIWGLSGPVYTLFGGVLGFISRPIREDNTVQTTNRTD